MFQNFKNHAENEAGGLAPDHFFLKSFKWGQSKWSAAWFQYISIAFNLVYNKNKLYKIEDYRARDMLSFCISEKGQGIVSPPHFVYDFSKKTFLILYSITDQISSSDMITFIFWDIGQYVFSKFLFPILWRHEFWN